MAASKAKTGVCLSDEGDDPDAGRVAEAERWAGLICMDARPATARRYTAASPLAFADPDELSFWLGRDFDRGRKSRATAWAVAGRELDGAVNALRAKMSRSGTRWAYLDDPGILAKHGRPLVFVGSTDGGREVQALFACARSLTVWCHQGREVSFDYRIYGELIYVELKKRGRGLGAILTAAVAMCVQDDLRQVCSAWRRSKCSIPASAWISGEAHSLGGKQAFETLHSITCFEADMAKGIKLEIQQDWSV